MAESGNYARVLNVWKLNFQKMGLELKCSLCLNTLNRPMLLPCDHIFCCTCIQNSTESGSKCPICFCHYVDKDLRCTPHMENILSLYKSMEAALTTIHFQSAPQALSTDGEIVRDQNHKRSLNQMTQPSPCSPPSFGETKDSDDDRSEHGGEQSAKSLQGKGAVTNKTDDGKISGRPNTNGEEDYSREMKRQKLEFGCQDMASDVEIHEQSNNLDAGNGLRFHSDTGPKTEKPSFGANPSTSDSLLPSSAFICGFCQSYKVSEASGPMLHYLKGKPVEMDKLSQPNVLHVHTKCIDWAPRVYYDEKSQTIKNLESELARAAKLKCNECGVKGAALGCLNKSCKKSFHVPCAVFVDECRWDIENFVMLCPSHSSQRFPSERSKSTKKNGNKHHSATEIAIQQPDLVWAASPGTAEGLVICGSALSSSDKDLLLKFSKISGATVSKAWDTNVTHVIADTDENGAFCRTLKVLMAILNGRWILSIDWIKACMEARKYVNEESYEINIDIYGCQDGPKQGRLRIMDKAPKLFDGLQFYFCGYYEPSYMGYLEELVDAAGGTILMEEMLLSQGCDTESESSTRIVVYSLNAPSGSEPKDISLLNKRQEAEGLAVQTLSWAVGHTWILESIAACKLQPFSS
ncbi:Breast cancer susceptibility 1-like protein [Thalictrum thalictroides]|uniref:RING-type E3 ubiquitin transferase BRCA1 n=1 Tax=Thalictrum thalictroides TaxID=46969 RepID=A0A7J6V6V3_THATH|nr:Breast cancer susceptibility 1-like protein [Thalictrum thalictroides]